MALLGRLLGHGKPMHGAAQPDALDPRALPEGTLLGTLRIERLLGRGSSALVYGAIDTETEAAVAVKVWCPSPGDSDAGQDTDAQRERFLREAQHASALQHPSIVRIFGGGQVRGVAFLAMALLPGSSLARWATPARILPEAAVIDIAAQLAHALAYAHRQGVLHRDVKPANVIFDPATRRAVLTDFGLSRTIDAQATRSGMLVGSPSYMAPELLAGAAPGAAADLYALGVLTYELLAGRPPFDQPGMGDLLRAVATQAPPPLAQVRPDLKGAHQLDRLLAPLLAKDPADRVADASEWAAQARVQGLWLSAPGLDLE